MDLTLIAAVTIGAFFVVALIVDWRRRSSRAVDDAVVENAMLEAEAARERARASVPDSIIRGGNSGIAP